jgi:hypothetical protein
MEGEEYGLCLSKRNLHFLAVLCWSMGRLPAYFLSKQMAHNAMLLPVMLFLHFCPEIQDCNW